MVCCSGTLRRLRLTPGASSLSQAILPLCTPSFIYDTPHPPPRLLLELHSAVPPSQPSSTCHLAVGRIYDAELLDLSHSPLTTPCLALSALGWSAHSSYKRLTHAARLDCSLSPLHPPLRDIHLYRLSSAAVDKRQASSLCFLSLSSCFLPLLPSLAVSLIYRLLYLESARHLMVPPTPPLIMHLLFVTLYLALRFHRRRHLCSPSLLGRHNIYYRFLF